MRSHWRTSENSVLWKYQDGALITDKKSSVRWWTLLTLNGRHFAYVAEGEGLFAQFSDFNWRPAATCKPVTSAKCKTPVLHFRQYLPTTVCTTEVSAQCALRTTFWCTHVSAPFETQPLSSLIPDGVHVHLFPFSTTQFSSLEFCSASDFLLYFLFVNRV